MGSSDIHNSGSISKDIIDVTVGARSIALACCRKKKMCVLPGWSYTELSNMHEAHMNLFSNESIMQIISYICFFFCQALFVVISFFSLSGRDVYFEKNIYIYHTVYDGEGESQTKYSM